MTARWQVVPVPGLAEGIILFDGVCVLCSAWVRFVIDRDPGVRFRFLAIQSPAGRALAGRFGIDPDRPETNVVIVGGRAHFKSDAALAVLSRLPGWKWTRAFRLVPRRARDGLYDRVARNRYRLFGRHGTCLVPSAGLDRHFFEG